MNNSPKTPKISNNYDTQRPFTPENFTQDNVTQHEQSDEETLQATRNKGRWNPEAPEFRPNPDWRTVKRINTVQLQPVKLMMVPTKVNGVEKEYSMLLDTGAQESFVSEKVVKELGLPTKKLTGQQMRGIGSDGLITDLTTAELTCSILGVRYLLNHTLL